MVSIIEFEQDNFAGFQIQHYIDEACLKKIVHEMEERAWHHEKVYLYFEFTNFGGWDSIQSFFDMLKLRFSYWNKISRYAIVTDKDWVKKQSGLVNFLMPHCRVRAFDIDEKEQALEWLQQSPQNLATQGVSVLEAMPDHVMGLAALNKLTSSDYCAIDHMLEEHVQKNYDPRLYLEVLHKNGAAPADVWEELKQAVKYYNKFSKVAIAGYEEWLQRNGKDGKSVPPGGNVKFFKLDERDSAMDWLK